MNGESFKNLINDGAWFWYPAPKAVYYEGKYKRTYLGWVSRTAKVGISCYDHQTEEVTTMTLKEKLNADSHSVPSLLIRPDGHLVAFYAKHYGREAFLYRISKKPEDISCWNEEVKVNTNGNFSDFINVVQLTKENNRVYLFCRGDILSVSNDGTHWNSPKKLMETKIMEKRKRREGHPPYIKVVSDGQYRIHIALVECGPLDWNDVKTSVFYTCYYNGIFHRADGSEIKSIESLPLEPGELEKIYDGSLSGFPAWLGDIAIDRDGNPVIIYHVHLSYPKRGLTDLRYRYAIWNGRNWDDNEITPAPSSRSYPYRSGGITFDHSNPSIVYLSKPTNGIYEIEKWTTVDGGNSWGYRRITSGSKKDNIRPVVPRGHKNGGIGLIWMYGDYLNKDTAKFGDYNTTLKFAISS